MMELKITILYNPVTDGSVSGLVKKLKECGIHPQIEVKQTEQRTFGQQLTFDTICKKVCDFYKIPVDNIKSRIDGSDKNMAKHVVRYFAYKKDIGLSMASIAQKTGTKQHSNVIASMKVVNNMIKTDKTFSGDFVTIKRMINNL